MRYLPWSTLLTLALVASAAGAQTPTPQARLIDALQRNRLSLTMSEGRPAGPGWDWLVLEPGPSSMLRDAVARLQHQGLIEALPADDRRRPYRLSDQGAKVLAAQLESLQQIASTGLRRLARE